MLREIIDFIFPPTCPICGNGVSEHGQLCLNCWKKFNWISDPKCVKCGYPFPANLERDSDLLCPDCLAKKHKLDWMRSSCIYDDASRSVILPFKHASKLEFREIISRAMIGLLKELEIKETSGILVLPVPLAYRRLCKRGYNQAAVLAKPVAKYLGAKIDYDSVARIYRPDMGHKTRTARAKNIQGVFKIQLPEKIRGKNILLVDDVFTTGATFGELAKVLKKAGANWVGGVTFCRVVRAI